MTQPLNLSARSDRSSEPCPRFSRLAIGVGMFAGALCCLAVQSAAGRMENLLFDSAWRAAVTRSAPQQAFGEGQRHTRLTKVLDGVSGEAFSPGAMHAALEQAGVTGGDGTPSNVSPAAWDRLSAGDCITLTTKSGQMLSFRIIGSHPVGEPPMADALPKIDLAVTTCTGTGEPVAKAVIEPARQQPAKGAVAQRTL